VVFRAKPGGQEGYVSHFAIADDTRGVFRYDQRILSAADVSASAQTLDLKLDDWTMRGGNGEFSLYAAMPDYTLDASLSTTKPAALHDGDGYIDYGNGTATYYYSWTRLHLQGTLTTAAGAMTVTGTAWMDHQWGDFLTYQEGGWDWFAVQLDNGIDVMVYVVRAADGSLLRVDGTIVAANGEVTILRPGEFSVAATGTWRSPHTGTVYPSGWEIAIPEEAIAMTVTPTMRDQELDTRPTTGVIYWEGESTVKAMMNGQTVDGRGYVELTGYAPFEPPRLPRATPTP
jgi:predicted secreted hydrolase